MHLFATLACSFTLITPKIRYGSIIHGIYDLYYCKVSTRNLWEQLTNCSDRLFKSVEAPLSLKVILISFLWIDLT